MAVNGWRLVGSGGVMRSSGLHLIANCLLLVPVGVEDWNAKQGLGR